ncbi:MAG TPA: ABC transporter ATP-binding protein [Patescibacteria group bacterium]|nr:ABC transporter ATP-binding protein [Patescibacteria group bacterium]
MENTSSGPILKVENLNVYYGSQQAVSDVSFSIEHGEIFGLLGPNGAGKTSTLSSIEGLITPQSGSIYIAGYDIQTDPVRARANMGVQLQSTSFQSELNVLEILNLYAGLYGVPLTAEKIKSILQDIQLESDAKKHFGQLSGGQQQRVSLVIATIHNPTLALLDEPTVGLDPQSRRQLWGRIEVLRGSGKSVLLTTHSMEEAEAVCNRIAIIDHGKILATNTPAGLIDQHREDPRVIKVSRGGKITLEDVFIGLTGETVRR